MKKSLARSCSLLRTSELTCVESSQSDHAGADARWTGFEIWDFYLLALHNELDGVVLSYYAFQHFIHDGGKNPAYWC